MRKYLLTYAILLVWATGLNAQCCSSPEGLVCEDAIFICGQELDGYTYTMSPDISPGNDYPSLCSGGQPDNIYWYAFVACSATVQLEITPTNCQPGEAGYIGVQAGIHGDCDLSEPVVCVTTGTTVPFILGANSFVPGQVYYLFIDGSGGSVCDIRIDIITGIDTSDHLDEVEANIGNLEDLNPGQVEGISEGCIGLSGTYTFQESECLDYLLNNIACLEGVEDDGFVCYEWSIAPATGASFLDDINCGKSVIITYDEPGQYEVSVMVSATGYGACIDNSDCTVILPLTVTIAEPDTTILPIEYICANDCISFCGQIVCAADTVICNPDPDNCNVSIQEVVVLTEQTIDLGTKYVCPGNCFTLNNVEYCDEGSFTIDDASECNIKYDFNIATFDLTINADDQMDLNCTNNAMQVNPEVVTDYPGNLTIEWKDSDDQIVSTILNPSFNTEGTYTLEITADENPDCVFTHNLEVNTSFEEPVFDLDIPSLDCQVPQANIQILNINDIQTVAWTGPNGFMSDELSPLIDDSGMYTLTLTNSDGCIKEMPFTVQGDFDRPNLEVAYDEINCIEISTQVTYVADMPIMMQEWKGPNDFLSADPFLTLFDGGAYSLMVTSSNGCTQMSFFDVVERTTAPSVDMPDELLWECNTVNLDVIPVIDQATDYDVIWSSQGGSIDSDPEVQPMTASSTGIYYIDVINNETGCATLDSVRIKENDNVPVEITFDLYDPSCFNFGDGYLDNIEVLGGDGPYSWTLNEIQVSEAELTNLSSGNFTLEVMDDNGCTTMTTFELYQPEEIILNLPETIEITYGFSGMATVTHNVPEENIASIDWYNEDGAWIGEGETISIEGMEESDITAILTSTQGCEQEAVIRLLLNKERDIVAPNIFSPNGDGQNDRFIPFFANGEGDPSELLIYDRMGQLVFHQKETLLGEEAQGWDGTMNGEDLLPGVYVYIIKYASLEGNEVIKAGDLTLIR